MFNSKIPLSNPALLEQPLSIQGRDGIETFKIDEHTIGVRPKWISVKERMPPNSVYVLVAIYDPRPKVEMYFIQIAERMNNNWFDGHHGDCIASKYSSVTHWMPLPKPPSIARLEHNAKYLENQQRLKNLADMEKRNAMD